MISSLLALLVSAADPTLVTVDEQHRALLHAFSDGAGHYVFVSGADAETQSPPFYYGDGKTMFQQRVVSHASASGRLEATFKDQRFAALYESQIVTQPDFVTLDIKCGTRTATLKPVENANELIAKAVYKRLPHDFVAYILARDDLGNYYFVDHGRFEDNANVYRVFVGPRGALKPQKLKNIVHDSGGDIFATAGGELRLVTGQSAEWIKGKKHVALTGLPIEDNVLVIYNDLGVYKNVRLGTPCDDF